jgi:NTE family protein
MASHAKLADRTTAKGLPMAAKIGVVLGSGGARGWAHIGVLEALRRMDIVPDIICGASMGALVAAAFATGRLEALRARLEKFGWRDIVPMIDVQLTTGGLIEGRRIGAFLDELGITGQIESLPLPYAAVATELASGREVWMRTGSIGHAVRASIGIPGIFSPTRDADSEGWLVDGGVANPVPVSLARAMGADIIIAVDLNADILGRRFEEGAEASAPPAPAIPDGAPQVLKDLATPLLSRLVQARPSFPSYFEVLANSLNIMQDYITRARLVGDPPHVHLRPQLRDFSWLDFHRAPEAIAEGVASVERAESVIRHYCAAGKRRDGTA